MGKGVALMFKEAFPENFKAYEAACKKKEVKVGHMFVTERQALMGPKWIINFPTKEHWRGDSKMAWIEAGLEDLKRVIKEKKIRSIAIPRSGAETVVSTGPRCDRRLRLRLLHSTMST